MFLKDIDGNPKIRIEPTLYHIDTVNENFVTVYYDFQICDIKLSIGDTGNQYKEHLLNNLLDVINEKTDFMEFSDYNWDIGNEESFGIKIKKLENIFYVESYVYYLKVFDDVGKDNPKIYSLVNKDNFNCFLWIENHKPGYIARFYTNEKYLREFVNRIFRKLEELKNNPWVW